MVSENAVKNAGYLQIMSILVSLRKKGIITADEYRRAQEYYFKLTGADIVITDLLYVS